MPDNDLTDDEIALLCANGEADPTKLTGNQTRDLERLISRGYVEPVDENPGSAFKPTAKGMEFLGERGAGLNEA
jgi:hypothetical protein